MTVLDEVSKSLCIIVDLDLSRLSRVSGSIPSPSEYRRRSKDKSYRDSDELPEIQLHS